MSADNVRKHRESHEAFNAGDIEGSMKHLRPDVQYVDHPRGDTITSVDGLKDWLQAWRAAFSDASIAEATYLDAGDYTVARFSGRGTNDGPFGPFPATNNQLDAQLCEILHWDANGMNDSGGVYYDQLSMLVQLGHMPAPQV